MKFYHLTFLISCLTGFTVSINISRGKQNLSTEAVMKDKGWSKLGKRFIDDSEPIFKNLSYEFDRNLGIDIIKTAAESPEAVPNTFKVLEKLIQKYKNKREGATTDLGDNFFKSLKNFKCKVSNLKKESKEVLAVCSTNLNHKCLIAMSNLKPKFLQIKKQIKVAKMFMPKMWKTDVIANSMVKEILESINEILKPFKTNYLKIINSVKSEKVSKLKEFKTFMENVEIEINSIIEDVTELDEEKKDLTEKLYKFDLDILVKLGDAQLLRSYLADDFKEVKLSDIIFLFKKRILEYKKTLKTKYKPKMPIIDELPELEGIKLDEIQEETQIEYFKRELEKTKGPKKFKVT